jgi:hypothetical protein
METLQTIFPSADDLLSMPIEDLAPILIKLAAARVQGAGFIPEAVTQLTIGVGMTATATGGYPGHKQAHVDAVLSKAWNWLERDGFIEPSPGMNGRNGWRILTDKGQAIADGQDFRKLREAMAFPKELLHPAIREKVWGALRRDELDEAVRTAFVAVEEAVREAGGFAHGDFGVDLMRKAFHADIRRHPVPTRGALRDRHGRWGRDAVDAAVSGARMRAGRMILSRTAKSCGPDAPTLVSSLRSDPQATVARKPGHRGEREVSR